MKKLLLGCFMALSLACSSQAWADYHLNVNNLSTADMSIAGESYTNQHRNDVKDFPKQQARELILYSDGGLKGEAKITIATLDKQGFCEFNLSRKSVAKVDFYDPSIKNQQALKCDLQKEGDNLGILTIQDLGRP